MKWGSFVEFVQQLNDSVALKDYWEMAESLDFSVASAQDIESLGKAIFVILPRIERPDLQEALLILLSNCARPEAQLEADFLALYMKWCVLSKAQLFVRVELLRGLYLLSQSVGRLSQESLLKLREHFESSETNGKEFLLLSGILLEHELIEVVKSRLAYPRFRDRLAASVRKIHKNFDQAKSKESFLLLQREKVFVSIERERIFLNLAARLEGLLEASGTGQQRLMTSGSPTWNGETQAFCGSCGHRIVLRNDRTAGRMQLKCAKCGGPMSTPADSE